MTYQCARSSSLFLFLHLIVTVVRLARPGGLSSVVAEPLPVKHQLRILNRGRRRAPNLRAGEQVKNPTKFLSASVVTGLLPASVKSVRIYQFPCLDLTPSDEDRPAFRCPETGGNLRVPTTETLWFS